MLSGGDLDAWYINPKNNYGPDQSKGQIDVWVDRNSSWVTPASARNDTVRMTGLTRKFLTQVMYGDRLMIDTDQDGQWDAWFSLRGSAAAFSALSDCQSKL